MRSPALLRRILLAGIVLCSLFIALSLVMIRRNSEIVKETDKAYTCREFREDIGTYVMQPGCRGIRNKGGGDAPFSINADGFRDREFGPRRAGTLRVALMGFSLWMAGGVPDDAALGVLLQKELAARGRRDVEVINLSVEGYRLANHSVRFLGYLEKYHPDLIVAGPLNLETLADDLVRIHGLERDDKGNPRRLKSGGARLYKEAQARSLLGSLRAYYEVIHHSLLYFKTQRHLKRAFPDPADRAEAYAEPSVRILHWMEDRAVAAGAKLAVVWDGSVQQKRNRLGIDDRIWLAGTLNSIASRAEVDPQLVRDTLKESGVGLFEMTGRVPGVNTPQLLLGKGPYMNAEGMHAMARNLADELIKVLPKAPQKAKPRGR